MALWGPWMWLLASRTVGATQSVIMSGQPGKLAQLLEKILGGPWTHLGCRSQRPWPQTTVALTGPSEGQRGRELQPSVESPLALQGRRSWSLARPTVARTLALSLHRTSATSTLLQPPAGHGGEAFLSSADGSRYEESIDIGQHPQKWPSHCVHKLIAPASAAKGRLGIGPYPLSPLDS